MIVAILLLVIAVAGVIIVSGRIRYIRLDGVYKHVELPDTLKLQSKQTQGLYGGTGVAIIYTYEMSGDTSQTGIALQRAFDKDSDLATYGKQMVGPSGPSSIMLDYRNTNKNVEITASNLSHADQLDIIISSLN